MPGSVRSLAMLICTEAEMEAHLSYIGSALYGLLQYASQGKTEFPSWGEAFPPQNREQEEETADDILKKLVRELGR